jgi:hypothetical protein
MSSTRCSADGGPATGSDSPVPGLSNMTRRQNDVMRRNIAFACGSLHISAMCETIPLDSTRSIGPSPATW